MGHYRGLDCVRTFDITLDSKSAATEDSHKASRASRVDRLESEACKLLVDINYDDMCQRTGLVIGH